MVNDQILKHLWLIKQKIFVLNPVNVVALTYNPYSPLGENFSALDFCQNLKQNITLPIFNVLEKSGRNE
jgi:hypothetical protein